MRLPVAVPVFCVVQALCAAFLCAFASTARAQEPPPASGPTDIEVFAPPAPPPTYVAPPARTEPPAKADPPPNAPAPPSQPAIAPGGAASAPSVSDGGAPSERASVAPPAVASPPAQPSSTSVPAVPAPVSSEAIRARMAELKEKIHAHNPRAVRAGTIISFIAVPYMVGVGTALWVDAALGYGPTQERNERLGKALLLLAPLPLALGLLGVSKLRRERKARRPYILEYKELKRKQLELLPQASLDGAHLTLRMRF